MSPLIPWSFIGAYLRTRIRGPPEKSPRPLFSQPKTEKFQRRQAWCVFIICAVPIIWLIFLTGPKEDAGHIMKFAQDSMDSQPPLFSWLAPIMAKLFQAWSCFFDDWLGVFCTWASEGRHFFSFDYQSPNALCMESLFTFTIDSSHSCK